MKKLAEESVALSLKEVEMLIDIAIKTAKKIWNRNLPKFSSYEESAADREAISRIASELLEHWLEEGIHPNDLEEKGAKNGGKKK